MTESERDRFNERIIEIWDKASSEFKDYTDDKKQGLPMFSPCFVPGDYVNAKCKLLIIGLNPSYSYSNWKKILDNYSDSQIDEVFKYENIYVNKGKIIDLDSKAINEVPYFKKMIELNKYLFGESNTWLHLDLFFYRKTSRKKLEQIIKTNAIFFKKQLEISKEIIQSLKPEIILVANAFAGEIFRKLFINELDIIQISDENQTKEQLYKNFYDKYFNEDTGNYDVGINNNKVKVFFSGMLSGQHSLDLGSYERLKWHIKAVTDGKKMTK